MYVANLWKRYSAMVTVQSTQSISGLSSLLVGDTCLNNADNMTHFSTDVDQFTYSIYSKVVYDIYIHNVDLVYFEQTANGFQQLLTNLSECFMKYKNLLDNVKTWSDEVSSSLADNSSTVDLSAASKLQTTLSYACSTASPRFKNVGPSLQDLVDQVNELYDTSVSLDDIDSSIFSTLTSINDNLQTIMKDAYHKLFDQFGQINNYMNSTDKIVENFLRGLRIWRYPYINLENQQVD
jgi:ABC-type transporter Mla subunit MlaD